MRITKIEATRAREKKKLRVAAYARVSTDSEEQLISLDVQKNHYEKYIKSRPDWEYVGIYYDEGISGTKLDRRNGLRSLLSDCDKSLIDYIVVKSISRFSRNTVDTIEIVRKLYSKGIHIYFEKENIDTGKMEGELLLSILSSLAEGESRSLSQNVTWGTKKRFINGTFILSDPPYGYNNIDGILTVDEEKAEIVRRIFSKILAGETPEKIAEELNELEIPAKRGGKWRSSAIYYIIRNEKYIGEAKFQKKYTDDRFHRHTNHGERDSFYIKEHHEPIISKKVFETVGMLVTKNGNEKGVKKDDYKYLNRYAFSGKIICSQCGATYRRRKRKDYFEYVCNTHLKDKDTCGMKAISEESIKAAFNTMLNKLTFARGAVLVQYRDMLLCKGNEGVQDQISVLEDKLQKNQQRQRQIQQFYAMEYLTPAMYEEQRDELLVEEQQMTEQRDALVLQISGNQEQQKALESLMKMTASGSLHSEFDPRLFNEHVDHIIVFDRTEIGFVMKCGPTFRERI